MPSVNDPQVMEVGIGSAFGFGAARSLAKLYDYVANEGRVGDKILLPEKLIKILTTSITDTMKRASSMTIPFTVGLMKYKNSQVRNDFPCFLWSLFSTFELLFFSFCLKKIPKFSSFSESNY